MVNESDSVQSTSTVQEGGQEGKRVVVKGRSSPLVGKSVGGYQGLQQNVWVG